MNLDYCIIGAAKSGTTAVFDALCSHPRLFRPARKELNYWAYDEDQPGLLAWGAQPPRDWPARTRDEYEAYFAGAPPGTLLGEASVVYLESHFAPAALSRHNPHARLIALLRDPVERAWSGYWMARRNGWTQDSIQDAFDLDANRVHSGRYGYLLTRYFDYFDREQIFIEDFARVLSDPAGLLEDLFTFIGVEPDATASVQRMNQGGVPRSPRMHRLLHSGAAVRAAKAVRGTQVYGVADRLRRANLRPSPEVDPLTARRLRDFYSPDIEQLERLSGRDFSHWRRSQGGWT